MVSAPDSSALLLIDSGWPGSGRAIRRAMRAIGRTPDDLAAIAITHWHGDHTGSIDELLRDTTQPVTIYGGAADLDIYLAQKARPLYIRPYPLLPRGMHIPHAPGRLCRRPGISYVRLAEDNLGSALSEWGIEALPMPGHTPGHTAYRVLADNAVCCGDGLVHLGPDLYALGLHEDLQQMDASALWLLEQPFEWLLPAHVTRMRAPLPPSARVRVGEPARGLPWLIEHLHCLRYRGHIG